MSTDNNDIYELTKSDIEIIPIPIVATKPTYHKVELNTYIIQLPKDTPEEDELSFFEKLGLFWELVKKLPSLIGIIIKIMALKEGLTNMTIDKKTTIATVVALVATVLGLFVKQFQIPAEVQSIITDAIYAVWVAVGTIIGLFTGKKDETK